MTLQDLEHRVENVEAQHATYITVLSNHTAAIAGLTSAVVTIGSRLDRIEQVLTTVVADVAALRQDVTQRLDSLESFLRERLNGRGRE
jgi:hypothetical protein